MQIAIVDMLFSWPPNGGADVDLYHIAEGLTRAGHAVHVIAVHVEGSTERGLFTAPETLPFELEVLRFTQHTYRLPGITQEIKRAVDRIAPELVFVQHGYGVKPYVLLALKAYRLVSRYYAYEFFCARDSFRFRDGAPCPNSYLETPDICRTCAFEAHGAAIAQGKIRSWAQDYLAAQAYLAGYHRDFTASLECIETILICNNRIRGELSRWHGDVRTVPHGVHPDRFDGGASASRRDEKLVILMTGRADDPLKGLPVLLEAGKALAATRSDFIVQATHFDQTTSHGFYESTGWLTHEETLERYQAASICVIPSVWEEPFGIVALEAMAARIPVVASRTGGLQDIVVHDVTGLLVKPGDSGELALALARLLDSSELRRAMGDAGRLRVEMEYTWPGVIEKHYLPLLEREAP